MVTPYTVSKFNISELSKNEKKLKKGTVSRDHMQQMSKIIPGSSSKKCLELCRH